MDRVLSELLASHAGRTLDVASAFFSLSGYPLLKDGLGGLGSFRLLLGSEPRGHSEQSVYELLPRAVAHIVQASARTAAGEQARPKLPPDQIAVSVALQQAALQAGVPREVVIRLLKFLSNPMTRFAERQFRQFLGRYQTDKDLRGLADAVDDLRGKFEGADAAQEAETRPPLRAEDLRLVCFEYLS